MKKLSLIVTQHNTTQHDTTQHNTTPLNMKGKKFCKQVGVYLFELPRELCVPLVLLER
jgi:hypothetical protein